MTTYFSRITSDHWAAKNKLEAAAKDLAREMDRHIIPADRANDFKNIFKQKVENLNTRFSRCKPLELEIWKPREDRSNDICIQISGVFCMELISIKTVPIFNIGIFELKSA